MLLLLAAFTIIRVYGTPTFDLFYKNCYSISLQWQLQSYLRCVRLLH